MLCKTLVIGYGKSSRMEVSEAAWNQRYRFGNIAAGTMGIRANDQQKQ
ncbi:MAG: hypothetical protein IKH43_08005 [Bacteroidaceae bacterium]|nr:hypothetical protein [Bacteroidaceae bacterium]